MKVHELAKKIDMPNNKLIEKMKDMGMDVTSHLNVVEEDDVKKVMDLLDSSSSKGLEKENQELRARLDRLEAMMSNKQETPTTEEDGFAEIPMNKPVRVMSLFPGGLNLKTNKDDSGQVFRFTFVGETYPILYADLVKSIALQRNFYKKGYCMILDKNVVKAHYLEEDYSKFIDAKTINGILEHEADKIKDIFTNTTEVIQQSIVDLIIQKINNNDYVDKNKISVISEVYGHDVHEQALKMR